MLSLPTIPAEVEVVVAAEDETIVETVEIEVTVVTVEVTGESVVMTDEEMIAERTNRATSRRQEAIRRPLIWRVSPRQSSHLSHNMGPFLHSSRADMSV